MKSNEFIFLCVTPHTPAAKAGIRAGDRLVAVNGSLIHDVLDYRFYMIDTSLTVEVERNSSSEETASSAQAETSSEAASSAE